MAKKGGRAKSQRTRKHVVEIDPRARMSVHKNVDPHLGPPLVDGTLERLDASGGHSHLTPLPFSPKIRYQATPIQIEAPTWFNDFKGGYIWNCNYEGLLMSESHYRLKNGAWSGGGPFYCFKRSQEHLGQHKATYYRNTVRVDAMPCGVAPAPVSRWAADSVPGFIGWDQAKLETSNDYATGYARARPGNPEASVGQFIYELNDFPVLPLRGIFKKFSGLQKRTGGAHLADIPKVLYAQLLDFKSLGSEYLNVVFGWEPFVKDLRQMYNLWKVIDKRMAQLVRENGKSIRRKAQVRHESDCSSEPTKTYPWAYANVWGAPPNWTDGGSRVDAITQREEKVWFSGSFRYYVPELESSLWDAKARLALFGVLPTPDLIWSVLPWTWLLDWFSNLGDIISNFSENAVGNLTCERSFIMRHYSQKTVYTCSTWHTGVDLFYIGGQPWTGWPALNKTFISIDKVETKCRVRGGNPYGLDVKWPDLTMRQLGVLAALGYTRS